MFMDADFTHSKVTVKRKLYPQCDDSRTIMRHHVGMEFFNTIKAWRNARRMTQQELADAGGISFSYVSQLERGLKPWNQELLADLGRALGCTVIDLIANLPDKPIAQYIPIAGRASAGPEGFFFSDHADGAHDALDPFPEGSIAAVVTGRSMWPRFKENEKIIFGPITKDPMPYVAHDVLACVDDGRMLIKTLKRNSYTGNWDLLSYNNEFGVIEDVRLDWIRPFEGMRA